MLKGMYPYVKADKPAAKHVQLFGGGCIMLQVQRAAEILKDRYGVTSDIWGVTSYQLEQCVKPDKLYSAEV
jgi:pyruvate dehydrogenase E1 component